ncbi:DUF5615 family PIN-like protein [Sphingobium sp.]|uniref:DUF5615 family PIN-like protein n=1 Tax=Sphingobium sp. TaxID=1912891 RepID=UPI002627348F|nr:DUF5615 family PIN-like protein [Sphingobium sp.]
MRLLLDENLPPRAARSLQALFEEHEIVALRHKFGRPGISDKEWIEALGGEGRWSVLTADRRIGRNAIEREAFLRNNLVGFVLAPSLRKRPLHQQIARLLYIWPDIVGQSELVSRGLFEISERGRMKQI